MNEALTHQAEMLSKDRNLFIFDWLFSLILSFIKFIDYKNINQRKTNHGFNFGGIDILPSLWQLLLQVKGQEEGCQSLGGKSHDRNGHRESSSRIILLEAFRRWMSWYILSCQQFEQLWEREQLKKIRKVFYFNNTYKQVTLRTTIFNVCYYSLLCLFCGGVCSWVYLFHSPSFSEIYMYIHTAPVMTSEWTKAMAAGGSCHIPVTSCLVST